MQAREQVRNAVDFLEKRHKEVLKAREQGRKERMPYFNMCFWGSVGTEIDKKSTAEYVAQLMYARGILHRNNVVTVHAVELRGAHVSETAKNMEEVAAKAVGGVLFIDDFYSFDSHPIGEVVDAMIATINLYKDTLCVIIAGDEEAIEKVLCFNRGIERRFPIKIKFSKCAKDSLMEALDLLVREKREQLEEDFKNEIKFLLNRRGI